MKTDFKELMEYLEYLINDSKINDEQRNLLIKLNDVIINSLQIDDIRNKVLYHSKIKDVNDRFKILLKKYEEEKKKLENKMACNILDYGSQRISFLEDLIDEVNRAIMAENTIIEEIIDKHLGYLQSNEQALLNNCLENLVGSKNYTSFFCTTLISKEKDTFIIDDIIIGKIYSILRNKTEFAKLEQATRLRNELATCRKEKEKIDLLVKYYNLIIEDEKLNNMVLNLDNKIRIISDEIDPSIERLIEQKDFYCTLPFGEIIFKNKINTLLRRIRINQKQQICATKLYDKKLEIELKKDDIEFFLRRKNLYFLFNDEKNKFPLYSKDALLFKQRNLENQINELQNSLNEIIEQFSDEYKSLYLNEKITCNNLVFELKDKPEKFISFYILLMLTLTEKAMNSESMKNEASNQLVNAIVGEYFEIQNDKILKIDEEENKVFSLRKR